MSNNVLNIEGYILKDNLLRLTLSGMFGTNDIKALKDWSERVGERIFSAHAGTGKKVKVLIDIRELEGYADPEVLTVLAELMKTDNPFVYKTASFGGNTQNVIAQDIIKVFAERNNLKNFKTEEEAVVWLNS